MQKPSQDETRNLILAAGLSFAVIILWQVFYVNPEIERQRALEAERNAVAEQSGAPSDPTEAGLAASGGAFGGAPLPLDTALGQSDRIAIKTPAVEGSISMTGGRLDELKLTRHRETLEPGSPLVELLWPIGTQNAYYAEFGWASPGGAASTPFGSTEWALAPGSPTTLQPGAPVTLRWDNGAGLIFERTIGIDDRYMLTVTQSVQNETGAEARLIPIARIIRNGTPERSGMFILHEGPVGVFDGTLEEIDYEDLADERVVNVGSKATGQVIEVADRGWFGFTDKYWMTALAPVGPQPFTAVFETETGGFGQPVYRARAIYPEKTIAAGDSLSVTTRVFAGAKEIGAIRDYQYLFDGVAEPAGFFGKLNDFFFYSSPSRFIDSIDWGWFFFLTKPIFEILMAINSAVGNMGVSIILLTLLFKTLLFPLAYKSFVSMSKLKKLQPDMKKIQEEHKDDRMAMQQAMMALYKKEKVNPASGCLPILLQIPIFFSLYKVLFVTLEIRHAPFFGWIQDLSARDPTSFLNIFGLMPWDGLNDGGFFSIFAIGIWPIIMGVTMWIQQMLNPAPTDPTQAQIFNMLPLLFTFMLGQFASGLVLYWTANNLFTILQQYSIMRSQGVDVDILGNMKRQLGLAPKESGN